MNTALTYTRILSENDGDISQLLIFRKRYAHCFLENGGKVVYIEMEQGYSTTAIVDKIYESKKLIGTIHLEKCEDLLYMDILIFPEYQRMGFATSVVSDIQNDTFGLNFKRIEIAIDESNTASIKLFERAGFSFVSKEDELLNYVYTHT